MEQSDNQPTAFEQEMSIPEPTEIERIQNRITNFTVGLKPATAEAALASMSILLSKGLLKMEELDAAISIREEINKGLIDYQTAVQVAQKDMERAQQNLVIQQQEERQRILTEKDTQIEDERLLRKRTQDNLEHQMNRAAQMEAVLKSHGINIDLDGDGVVGLKEGQVADTLSASEQAEVDNIVHGYDANGSPTTETVPYSVPTGSGKPSGAFKLARMMNPIEEGANGTTAEDMTPPVTHDPALQEKIEETKEAFDQYEESKYIPTDVPQSETTTTGMFDLDKESRSQIDPEDYNVPPQVAGGLIAGEDTESFLDEVERVQEVADIDAMTDTEEEESFESEWSEPTLDIGYDKPQPTIEEMDGVEKVEDLTRREKVLLDPLGASQRSDEIQAEIPKPQNVSAPVITAGNAPNIVREELADGVFIERENIKSFAEQEDLVTEEEEFEEVVIPNRTDLEGMTKKEILASAGNLSFDVDSKLTKPLMIDSFESQANSLIEELTAGESFESITEETVDGDDDRRDGGYF